MLLIKYIGGGGWLLATGLTLAIVCNAMGTQNWIISGIGILGIIGSSTGVYMAREAFQDKAFLAGAGAMAMWLICASFLIPSEINYWSATVTARAEHESDVGRQADARRRELDWKAKLVSDVRPGRTAAEVQAEIDRTLARKDGKTTLGSATGQCSDTASASYRHCGDVLTLRAELAKTAAYEKNAGLVWNAGAQLNGAEAAHGAHDGAARIARLLGGSAEEWNDRLLLVTVLLLAFMRDMLLFITWRAPKMAKALAPVLKQVAQPEITEQSTTAIAVLPESNVHYLDSFREEPEEAEEEPETIIEPVSLTHREVIQTAIAPLIASGNVSFEDIMTKVQAEAANRGHGAIDHKRVSQELKELGHARLPTRKAAKGTQQKKVFYNLRAGGSKARVAA